MNERTNNREAASNANNLFYQLSVIETGEICPNCGEKLRIGKSPVGDIAIACSCKAEAMEMEKRANIDKGRELARAQYRRNAGLGKKWRNKTFSDFVPGEGQSDAYSKVKAYADSYRQGVTAKGLYICGTVGGGKTHLAVAAANAAISKKIDALVQGNEWIIENAGKTGNFDTRDTPVLFTSTVDMLSQLKSSFGKRGDDSDGGLMRRIKTAPLLILDDFGAENCSEWALERLFEIINYRNSEELPVIITTNATPDELKRRVGDRICDRIREMCAPVTVKCPSHRTTAVIERIGGE